MQQQMVTADLARKSAKPTLAASQTGNVMPGPDSQATSSPDQPTVLDFGASPHGTADGTFTAGQRLGPYRIVRLLGEGGMGAVYLAEQVEPVQRPVALKLIRDQLRGGLAEAYFLVERQALARMDHPAIAKVYDAGTTPQGFPYFAMEWIDGSTLSTFCATHPPSPADKLKLFIRICRGVQHAHQKGVIHRDLKPSNVLIADVDGHPFPKIIDFGVAIGAAHSTSAGSGTPLMQRAGTRGYMSPEQIQGDAREIDIRSDVYALGVMLLELLAPASVFDVAVSDGLDNLSLHAALLASLGQQTAVAPAIRSGLAAIPAELRWIIAKAMEPQRTRRYDSAEVLASDLERYLSHRPVLAVPQTQAYRMQTFVSRHRAAIAASTIVVLALVAGLGAAVYGMLSARDAAVRATIEADKSKATSKFLTDVLSGVDPEQARDLDKTLLHLVLDKAADRADRELVGQPEVLAAVQKTIGSSYNSLGEYKRALEHTQHAYDIAHGQAGPDAALTLDIEQQLGLQLGNTGKLKEGGEILERNVAALTRIGGPDERRTLDSTIDLIRNQREQGQYAQAEKRLEVILPAIERVDGVDGKVTIAARDLQAMLLGDMGRYDDAEPAYRDVIARETRLWGESDPKTLDSKNGLAILYLESHRFAEGAKILAEMLPVCEKMYGPEHGVTINIVSNLAGALRQQGIPQMIAASGPYYKRALDSTRKKYGERHMNTIIATHNYANYLLDVGDVEQAARLQQQALATSTVVLGADHPVTGEIHYGLGKALLRKSRYADAERELLAAVAEKRKDFGAGHWRLDEYLAPLVDLYKAWNKPQQLADWQAQRAALKPKPAGA
jgi:non-specific serine/threonine protein kinase/serine/threonine-protein kinase